MKKVSSAVFLRDGPCSMNDQAVGAILKSLVSAPGLCDHRVDEGHATIVSVWKTPEDAADFGHKGSHRKTMDGFREKYRKPVLYGQKFVNLLVNVEIDVLGANAKDMLKKCHPIEQTSIPHSITQHAQAIRDKEAASKVAEVARQNEEFERLDRERINQEERRKAMVGAQCRENKRLGVAVTALGLTIIGGLSGWNFNARNAA